MTEVFDTSSRSSKLGFLDLDPLKQRIVDRIIENEVFVRIDLLLRALVVSSFQYTFRLTKYKTLYTLVPYLRWMKTLAA